MRTRRFIALFSWALRGRTRLTLDRANAANSLHSTRAMLDADGALRAVIVEFAPDAPSRMNTLSHRSDILQLGTAAAARLWPEARHKG